MKKASMGAPKRQALNAVRAQLQQLAKDHDLFISLHAVDNESNEALNCGTGATYGTRVS